MTRLARSEDLCEKVLPDIPNDVTVQLISPELSWRDVQNLCAVSRGWRKLIQTRQIYDARVRSRSTEIFVVVDGCYRRDARRELRWDPLGVTKKKHDMICLYSMTQKIYYDLPPIHHLGRGIPRACQCVSVDGYLYVLGGASRRKLHIGSKRVYRLDLAGNAMQWQRCPDMRESRLSFGAAVKDGKIYVLGGTSRGMPVLGSEVYDPKVNAWSSIKPMPSLPFCHQVEEVGDKLVVHGGKCYSETWLNSPDLTQHSRLASECTEDACHGRHNADYIKPFSTLEIYDPSKDQWRSLKMDELDGFLNSNCRQLQAGKVKGVRRYFREWEVCGACRFRPIAAIAQYDDILTTGTFVSNDGDDENEVSGTWENKNGWFLLHGEGFGSEEQELEWDWQRIRTTSFSAFERSVSTPDNFSFTPPIMCPILL